MIKLIACDMDGTLLDSQKASARPNCPKSLRSSEKRA